MATWCAFGKLRALGCSFVLFVLVACGGSPPPPAAAPPSAGAKPPAEEADTAVKQSTADAPPEPAPAKIAKPLEAKPPTVKLLEAGAAPRKALRYKFKPGATEYVEMDMRMSMAVAMEGQSPPKTDLPTMRTTMKIESKEVTPEGDLRCAYSVEKVEVLKDLPIDPRGRASLESELGGLVGMHGRATISPRGVAKENEFELSANASAKLRSHMDNMRESIRHIYAPLPEEEVGKGGKWEVTSRVPLRGAVMDSKLVYTLTKIDKDAVHATVETTASAPPNQVMQLDNLPPGASATLVSLSGTGTGKVSPSFVHLVSPGTNKLSMETAFSVSAEGRVVQMKMQSDITMTMRRGKKPAAAALAPKK